MVGSSQSGGSGKHKIKYYICENNLAKNRKICSNKGIEAEPIENQVKQLMLDVFNKYILNDLINPTDEKRI